MNQVLAVNDSDWQKGFHIRIGNEVYELGLWKCSIMETDADDKKEEEMDKPRESSSMMTKTNIILSLVHRGGAMISGLWVQNFKTGQQPQANNSQKTQRLEYRMVKPGPNICSIEILQRLEFVCLYEKVLACKAAGFSIILIKIFQSPTRNLNMREDVKNSINLKPYSIVTGHIKQNLGHRSDDVQLLYIPTSEKTLTTRYIPITITKKTEKSVLEAQKKFYHCLTWKNVTGLTEVTLRKVYKELSKNWDDLIRVSKIINQGKRELCKLPEAKS
ncbi:hypothetical protein RND71_030694 [Anisodus tanguticus]|uniref:Uncharacterized protein n=1 Tax=Anisodus tanguticus TaxID=243964 RepID=A0AAE1RHW2_9SOLA|nr:hypothetical protein RND71_030694 [Anisodus tanguticus]